MKVETFTVVVVFVSAEGVIRHSATIWEDRNSHEVGHLLACADRPYDRGNHGHGCGSDLAPAVTTLACWVTTDLVLRDRPSRSDLVDNLGQFDEWISLNPPPRIGWGSPCGNAHGRNAPLIQRFEGFSPRGCGVEFMLSGHKGD